MNNLAKAQQSAVKAAQRELTDTFNTVYNLYDDPADIRNALLDLVPAIARKYGNMGSVAAAEWYEQMRAKWIKEDYTVDTTYDPDDVPMRQTVRRLAGNLWDGKDGTPADPDAMLRGLHAAMDRWVKAGGRETIERATRHDPSKPRYARVPQGAKTCAFCAMLASRGFVYSSAEAAGGDMNKYHHDCDCEIIPSWDKNNPKIEGYDPEKLYQKYLKARESLGKENPTLEEILEAMRRIGDYSDSFAPRRENSSGGFVTPPPSEPGNSKPSWPHDPNESRILSLKNEKNVTDSEWEQRQINAGGPSPDVEKMYPQEIVFLERVKARGEVIEWIPKGSDGVSRNDFKWLNHGGVYAELKSPASVKYAAVSKRIRDAVQAGQSAIARGTTTIPKDHFVIDFGEGLRIPDKLRYQLSLYNIRHPKETITELWIWDKEGLFEIELR